MNRLFKSFHALLIAVCLVASLSIKEVRAAEKNNFQFKKDAELQQIRPKKPVKIKLKRTAKDDYSWELSGDDADEIIRVDKKLRRLLGVQ